MVESRLEVLAPFSAALGKPPPFGQRKVGSREGVGKKGRRQFSCLWEEEKRPYTFTANAQHVRQA